MTLYPIVFYVLALVILTASVLGVTRRQPVHAVLYLVIAFLGTSALFFLLGAPLLAAFMAILYAGAIMILILFVIMLFRYSDREFGLVPQWGHAVLLGAVFFAVAAAMVFKDAGSGTVLQGAAAQPKDFGLFLFDRYWLAVEIVSILLLIALITVFQTARKRISAGTQGQELEEHP